MHDAEHGNENNKQNIKWKIIDEYWSYDERYYNDYFSNYYGMDFNENAFYKQQDFEAQRICFSCVIFWENTKWFTNKNYQNYYCHLIIMKIEISICLINNNNNNIVLK